MSIEGVAEGLAKAAYQSELKNNWDIKVLRIFINSLMPSERPAEKIIKIKFKQPNINFYISRLLEY